MSKLTTMYIPVKKATGKTQMLSIKRIKKITELLPSKEEILSHIYMERQLSILNKGYKPEPYIISLSVDNYDMIINEIQKKIPKYYTKSISLKASSISAPIIKIINEDNI